MLSAQLGDGTWAGSPARPRTSPLASGSPTQLEHAAVPSQPKSLRFATSPVRAHASVHEGVASGQVALTAFSAPADVGFAATDPTTECTSEKEAQSPPFDSVDHDNDYPATPREEAHVRQPVPSPPSPPEAATRAELEEAHAHAAHPPGAASRAEIEPVPGSVPDTHSELTPQLQKRTGVSPTPDVSARGSETSSAGGREVGTRVTPPRLQLFAADVDVDELVGSGALWD